ncbi:MAG: hypothetical protein U9N11_02790, partial [Campylobacterota bacterium]|nr:hypothetical protein [Campylobacterota bacterium]
TSQAQSPMQHPSSKMMSEKQIKKMDRRLNKHKAKRRSFNNQKEFLHKRKRRVDNQRMKNKLHRDMQTKHMGSSSQFNDAHSYSNAHYSYNKPMQRQRGYRHFQRGWMLAYRYDRASFYDAEGFYYGYFNHHGYYFEETFYRYDRFYSFKDRVRGRGLFDHDYYMPSDYRTYGFCNKKNYNNAYARNHNVW